MKYTLDTDFSALNGPKAMNWVLQFRELAEKSFHSKDLSSWLLGNLLVIESYVRTLREGLAVDGKQLTVMIPYSLDRLWDCLEGRTTPIDCQDFANNLWASTLCYNVGEEISDAHAEFYQANFNDVNDNTCEWQVLTWCYLIISICRKEEYVKHCLDVLNGISPPIRDTVLAELRKNGGNNALAIINSFQESP